MEWSAIIIPFILSALAVYYFKHKLVWWEIIIPTVVSIIAILVMKYSMIYKNTVDVEFHSEYIIEARFYEEWDEWIDQTCSYECCCDSDGNNCSTVYYDCSYRDYHAEYWEIIMNTGNSYYTSESYYKYLVKLFGNESFVNMNRDYYQIDGDMYKTKFDGVFEHVIPKSYKNSYKNKPQAAYTVFKFEDLPPEQTKELYEYPPVNNREQNACLGCSYEDNLTLRRYNGLLGRYKQVKMFILVFKDKDISVAEKQRHFWKGGNKNELVVCVDSEGKWARTFSWCDDKQLEVDINYLFTTEDLSMSQKIRTLESEVKSKWKRKEFSDFNYIKISLTSNQTLWLFIVVFIVSVGALCIGIFNEITE